MNRSKAALALIGVLTLVVACTVDDPFDPDDFESPVPVATQLAEVSGDGQTGAAGEPLDSALSVRALDQFGQPIAEATVSWSVVEGAGSVSATTTTTDSAGLASVIWTLGDSLGTYTARATLDGTSASIAFTAVAVAGAPDSIQVVPDTLRFDALGDTARVSVTAHDALGHPIDDPEVTWTSDEPDRASVNAGGLVTAEGPGTAHIIGASGDASDTTVVVVTQAPSLLELEPDSATLIAADDTATLRARAFDRNGRAIADATPAWSTGDSAVATVDSTGLVTAIGEGSTHVYAAFDTVSDSTAITVLVPTAIEIVPEADTLWAIGDTTRLAAYVTNAEDDTIEGAPLTWSSLDTLIATVDFYGRVTALDTGTVSIVAETGALGDTASIEVAPDTTSPDTASAPPSALPPSPPVAPAIGVAPGEAGAAPARHPVAHRSRRVPLRPAARTGRRPSRR